MGASTRLCTVDEAMACVLTDCEDGDNETYLSCLIERASKAIESYCRRQFGQVKRTEYHDGGSEIVVLTHRPIVEVGKVYGDPEREFPESTLVPDSYIIVKKLAGFIMRVGGPFKIGLNSVKVEYVSGYSQVPTDVREACAMLAAAWYVAYRNEAMPEEPVFPEQVTRLLEPFVEVCSG